MVNPHTKYKKPVVKNNLGKRFDRVDTEVSRAIKNPCTFGGGGQYLRVASPYTEQVEFFKDNTTWFSDRVTWNVR